MRNKKFHMLYQTDLVQPKSGHDEEELDAHCSEGEYTTKGDTKQRVRVPHLIGYVSRDLIGAHRNNNRLFLESKIATNENKGCAYTNPQEEHRQQSRKGGCCRGALKVHESIDSKEYHSNNTRE